MKYYDLIETPKTGKTFLVKGANRIIETDDSVSIYFQKIDKTKFTRYFDENGYPKVKEYELQEDGTKYSHYLEPENGISKPDLEAIKLHNIETALEHARNERQAKRYEIIEVDGYFYDADFPAYENLLGTIDNWQTLITDQSLISTGIIKDDKILWTLANNENIWVDKTILEKVVNALAIRTALLQVEYYNLKLSLEADEPIVEEPIVEEPIVEEPIVEEPI